MKNFIEVPTSDGNIIINLNHVVVVIPNNNTTVLHYVEGNVKGTEITMNYVDFKSLLSGIE